MLMILLPTADLEQVEKNDYQLYEIDKKWELLDFFKTNGMDFYRGRTFYEFKRKTEDIDQSSRIIIINKVG